MQTDKITMTKLLFDIYRNWQYKNVYRKMMNIKRHACIFEASYYLSVTLLASSTEQKIQFCHCTVKCRKIYHPQFRDRNILNFLSGFYDCSSKENPYNYFFNSTNPVVGSKCFKMPKHFDKGFAIWEIQRLKMYGRFGQKNQL